MNQCGKRIIAWHGHKWLVLLARIYLGLIFIFASWHKILDPRIFALDVATYQLLPLWAINGVALVLPWVELLTGTMLLMGLRVRAAALLTALMMLSFILALLWAFHLGLDMTCGCFASQAAADGDPISWHTVVRDMFWLSLAFYVFTFYQIPLKINRIFLHRKVSS